MEKEIYLSVIVPAYNEKNRLPRTLEAIDGYLSKQNYSYEILVVNDGSKDGTADATRELMSKILNLRLIDNRENRGKGYVVRQGLSEARGQYRLFTDADNSTSIDQWEKMRPYFAEGFDIVFGSRDLSGSILNPPQPWIRKIVLGEGFKLFRKIMIGLWGIADTQCGFKAFTPKALAAVLPACRVDRWAFDVEILVLAKRSGLKIKEIPITWVNDPDSKVKFKGIVKMAIDIVKIRFNLISGKYGR